MTYPDMYMGYTKEYLDYGNPDTPKMTDADWDEWCGTLDQWILELNDKKYTPEEIADRRYVDVSDVRKLLLEVGEEEND